MENKTKFSTKITKVGTIAKDILRSGNLILFADDIDDRLTAFAFLHPQSELLKPVEVDDIVKLGDTEFKVKEVGALANKELAATGHTMFVFEVDGDTQNQIVLEGEIFPELSEGDVLEIREK